MDWIKIEDELPKKDWVFKVKLSDGKETKAYFNQDRIGWIAFYGQKPSHWWDFYSNEALFNVTHWMPIPKEP